MDKRLLDKDLKVLGCLHNQDHELEKIKDLVNQLLVNDVKNRYKIDVLSKASIRLKVLETELLLMQKNYSKWKSIALISITLVIALLTIFILSVILG